MLRSQTAFRGTKRKHLNMLKKFKVFLLNKPKNRYGGASGGLFWVKILRIVAVICSYRVLIVARALFFDPPPRPEGVRRPLWIFGTVNRANRKYDARTV